MGDWYERYDSGEAQIKRAGHADASTFKKVWVVKTVEDYTEAHQEFMQRLEGFQGSLQGPRGVYYFGFEGYSAKPLGNGYWEVEATYQTIGGGTQDSADDPNNDKPEGGVIGVITNVTFETTGGTQHITSGYDENRYGPGAPDMKRAINVTESGVDGCDIAVPIFEWAEEYEIPGGNMTLPYLKIVADLTGTVNKSTFRGFPAGEVLFLGCSGTQTYNPSALPFWEKSVAKISYRFAQRKNEEDKKVPFLPGVPNGYSKKGWDFVWVYYTKNVDEDVPLATPRYLYTNKVYEDGDFKKLRLPG